MNRDFLDQAHKHSFSNRIEIEGSKFCGCFNCVGFFYPQEITDWTDFLFNPEGNTALCPECSIDSVIGDASGFKLDAELLRDMNQVYFKEM